MTRSGCELTRYKKRSAVFSDYLAATRQKMEADGSIKITHGVIELGISRLRQLSLDGLPRVAALRQGAAADALSGG